MMGIAGCGAGEVVDDVVDDVLGEVAENVIVDRVQAIAMASPSSSSGCQGFWSRFGANIRINNGAFLGFAAAVTGGSETGLIAGRILVGSRIALTGRAVGLSLMSGATWSAPALASVAGPLGAIGLGLEIGNIMGSGISAAGHYATCN